MRKQATIIGALLGAFAGFYPALCGYLHVFKDEPQLSARGATLLVVCGLGIGALAGYIVGLILARYRKTRP
jgi:hypothetical protein